MAVELEHHGERLGCIGVVINDEDSTGRRSIHNSFRGLRRRLRDERQPNLEPLLRQALLNIVHNAIRYSPPGTRITLRLSRDRSEAIAEVIDAGPGIDAQHRTKVFDRFFRADAGRSRTDGGYGLGVAIAKASIERQGGRIEVTSELGHGSTFRIYLPEATAATNS